jgi:hypothetical protein
VPPKPPPTGQLAVCACWLSARRFRPVPLPKPCGGQRAFGENMCRNCKQGRRTGSLDIEWHFIGPLQSNKTRIVAQTAHWVHSIERLKIAQRLSEQRPQSAATAGLYSGECVWRTEQERLPATGSQGIGTMPWPPCRFATARLDVHSGSD